MFDLVKELTRRTLLHKAGVITLGIAGIGSVVKPARTLAQTNTPPKPPEQKIGWAISTLR